MNISKKTLILLTLLCFSICCQAALTIQEKGCGMTDYTGGSEALLKAAEFVSNTMVGVVILLYAIAAIVVVISALEIYIKMNLHEGDITKHILYLVGGAIFMLVGLRVIPSFFGYEVSWGDWAQPL